MRVCIAYRRRPSQKILAVFFVRAKHKNTQYKHCTNIVGLGWLYVLFHSLYTVDRQVSQCPLAAAGLVYIVYISNANQKPQKTYIYNYSSCFNNWQHYDKYLTRHSDVNPNQYTWGPRGPQAYVLCDILRSVRYFLPNFVYSSPLHMSS